MAADRPGQVGQNPPTALADRPAGHRLAVPGPAVAHFGRPANRLLPAQILAVAYVASVPFDGFPVGPRSLSFLAGLAFVVAALIDLVRPASRPDTPGPVPLAAIVVILSLVTYATASYFWAADPAAAASRLPTVLVLAVTCILLAAYLPEVWLAALWAYGLSAALLGALVLAAPAGRYEYRRTASGNEDDVAALLVLGCVIALYLAMSSTARWAVLATGMLIVCAVGTVATGSRAAVIAGSAGLLLALAGTLRRRQVARAAVRVAGRAAVLSVVGAAVVVTLPREFVPPRLGQVTAILTDRDLSNRGQIWTGVLARGVDLPGLGLGGTEQYLDATIGRANVAHNAALGVLAELGLVGLVLFAGVVAIAAIRGRDSAFRPVLLPLGAAMGLLSMSLTVEWRRCVWLLLAFALTRAVTGADRPGEPPR